MPLQELGGSANSEHLGRLRQISNDFSRAWQAAQAGEAVPRLKEFLPTPSDPLRQLVLEELIGVDLEERWRRHEFILLEQYLEQFPELGQRDQVPVRLLLIEFRVRHRFGDQPPLDMYQRRFPTQYHALRAQGNEASTALPEASDSPAPVTVAGPAHASQVLPISGEYHLIELLGRGTYGEVWRAEGPGRIEIALKVIHRRVNQNEDDPHVKRELQGLEGIKRLRHSYLLSTLAYWQMPDRLLIAMELADGTLLQRLQQCTGEGAMGIPAPELIRYMGEAAEALDFLHRNNVLHRDIKPANILLLQGHVKLGDFGLARVVTADNMAEASLAGTPGFMAPESWEGHASSRSDQYSLASTYAELRLGRRLYEGANIRDIWREHLLGTPRLDPLPQAEQEVLKKALHREPEERYGTCHEFVAALASVMDLPRYEPARSSVSPGVGVFGQATLTPPQPPSRWRHVRTGLSVLGVLLVCLFAWWTLSTRKGAIALTVPAELLVVQGQSAQLEVTLQREGYGDAVAIDVVDLPEGVTVAERSVNADDENPIVLVVTAEARAEPRSRTVKVRARGQGVDRNESFQLNVVHVPAGCRPLGDEVVKDSSQRNFYRRVEYRAKEGPPFEFVLVRSGDVEGLDTDPRTFYIMKDKVSVAQFRPFAAATGWTSKEDDDCPALRVWGKDAFRFATEWIPGGRLPTLIQWEKAAGRYASGHPEGPYEGKWDKELWGKIAVSPLGGEQLTRPWKCGAASKDVSVYGCRDMAGNGLEWTRSYLDVDWKTVSKDNLNQLVRLVSQDYQRREPYQFRDERKSSDSFVSEPEENVGFRVVLEP